MPVSLPRHEDAYGQGLCILGSTGSIGTQTLDIVRLFPGKFRVRALSTWGNAELLIEQALEFRPECVVVGDESARTAVQESLASSPIQVLAGEAGLQEAAAREGVDTVVAALVGAVGLRSVLAAVEAGKKVALANKETLVVAGELVNRHLDASNSVLLPVDSEHSAIFQCLVGEDRGAVEQLILTASGGPFRTRPADSFADITPEEALDHPNWSMGAKITIDSATMMNKGLEVIEAHWLFDVDPARIAVLVHPQSIIHSMVTFEDGSTKAQLGVPDMKVPIQYALSYPERWPAPHDRIDWELLRCLDFEQPDVERFPCLRLAYEALEMGGTAPAVLNAANEQAVALFLADRITFTAIPKLIEGAVLKLGRPRLASLDELMDADREARRHVDEQKGGTR